MYTITTTLVMALACSGIGQAKGTWAEKLFVDGLTHDFGTVPRGVTARHSFRIVNTLNVPVHIGAARISMRYSADCVASKTTLLPNEEGTIEFKFFAKQFVGNKTVTVFVVLDQPRFEEVRLWGKINSCEGLSMTLLELAFGKIRRGTEPTMNTTLSFDGYPNATLTRVKCDSDFVSVRCQEVESKSAGKAYQLHATVQGNLPEGSWITYVRVSTDEKEVPLIVVPVRVEVEPLPELPLMVFPGRPARWSRR
jgi:Protein of unknown function (DUF1573)